jgi:hypothetical protein
MAHIPLMLGCIPHLSSAVGKLEHGIINNRCVSSVRSRIACTSFTHVARVSRLVTSCVFLQAHAVACLNPTHSTHPANCAPTLTACMCASTRLPSSDVRPSASAGAWRAHACCDGRSGQDTSASLRRSPVAERRALDPTSWLQARGDTHGPSGRGTWTPCVKRRRSPAA